MAVDTGANVLPVFDLKSASLSLVALVLRTTDLTELAGELERRFADAPGLFDNEPVVIDLTPVAAAEPDSIDFAALITLLRERRMLPIAVKGGSVGMREAALAAGLSEAPETAPPAAPRVAPPETAEAVPPAPPASPALIVDKPLRSGQQVYARGGDLVVLAVVSFGAEVIADGSIHVYAPLRGRAIAGARGDSGARIFSTCMEPQLVSIAGTYRTTETALPADVQGKPAQVRLAGEKLVIEALKL
ncbi:septum site-determining protein MinC [Piscinibacter sp. XHJ-5]|uniref:septum site-determining protein MinC n=1 Tax=Piscinibacter sp. XHJ-5 TaxID=3037797 RepID=UPI0024530561|nr:septum site-determining protein MinC [Piscinibacter sp. XHJ-5]